MKDTFKYSNTLVQFIKKTYKNRINIFDKIKENPIIIDIITFAKNNNIEREFSFKKTNEIKNINKPEDKPLMMLVLLDLASKHRKSLTLDVKTFSDWYNKNHHKFNFSKFMQHRSEITDIVYNLDENSDRKELHDMLYTSNFIPLDVQHNAESMNLIKYTIEDSCIKMIIYDEKDEKNEDEKNKIGELIKKLINIVYTVRDISIRDDSYKPKLYIVILLLP